MSDKNRQDEEQSKQDVKLEDLPVEESEQEEVKGGQGFAYVSKGG